MEISRISGGGSCRAESCAEGAHPFYDETEQLESLHIIPKLAALFLETAGDDHVSRFGGNVFKSKGNLESIFTDSV